MPSFITYTKLMTLYHYRHCNYLEWIWMDSILWLYSRRKRCKLPQFSFCSSKCIFVVNFIKKYNINIFLFYRKVSFWLCTLLTNTLRYYYSFIFIIKDWYIFIAIYIKTGKMLSSFLMAWCEQQSIVTFLLCDIISPL